MAGLGARGFWILLVLCVIPVNQISEPIFISQGPSSSWNFGERHVSPSDSVELFRPYPHYMGPLTLKEIITKRGSEQAFAAIGEIRGIEFIRPRGRRPGSTVAIAVFQVNRALSPGPESITFFLPDAVYRSPNGVLQNRRPSVGFEPGKYAAKGDCVLGVFYRTESRMPEFSGVWGVLTLWHLKDPWEDEIQYLYQAVNAKLDLDAIQDLPASMNMKDLSCFYVRDFETDGRTLSQGIQAIDVAFAQAGSR